MFFILLRLLCSSASHPIFCRRIRYDRVITASFAKKLKYEFLLDLRSGVVIRLRIDRKLMTGTSVRSYPSANCYSNIATQRTKDTKSHSIVSDDNERRCYLQVEPTAAHRSFSFQQTLSSLVVCTTEALKTSPSALSSTMVFVRTII